MKPPVIYKESLSRIIDLNNQAQQLKFAVWKEHVVFSGHWWVGVFLTIVPWVVWMLFHKKECTDRLLYVAFFLMILSTFMDFLGTKLGWWFYYYDVIPFIPAFIPWDLTLIPVFCLYIIEFKPHLNPVFKGLLFSGITAFIAEPLFEMGGLYQPVRWNHYYSFVIFFIIYLLSHYLIQRKSIDPVSSTREET